MGVDHLPPALDLVVGGEAEAEAARLRAELDELKKRKRRQRKPKMGALIAQAERAGKTVSAVTTAEGVTLTFGDAQPTEASNPWLADLDKVTKQ
jgi:uncharacterized membrane protein